MTRPSNITASHADVDVAIARIDKILRKQGVEIWKDDNIRREKLAELLMTLTDLFNVEDQFTRSAAELFGAGLPETTALSRKRSELMDHVRDLTLADAPDVHVSLLRDTFDDYTVLQWRMFQTYNGFLAPGTEGV